MTIQFT